MVFAKSELISEIEEQQWMSHIRQVLEQKGEDCEAQVIQTSIFEVPMSVRGKQSEWYTPQVVCLGPYHRNDPRIHEMERRKLVLARRTHPHLVESGSFESLVHEMGLLDSKIRACYDRHLRFSREMLSWMMVVDAAFLLHFLEAGGGNWEDDAMARDVVMLENQIPMLVLRRTAAQLQHYPLQQMLVGLSEHLCPFRMEHAAAATLASNSAHILDFLYRVMVQPQLVIVDEKLPHARSTTTTSMSVFTKGAAWVLLKIVPLVIYCHLPALALILKRGGEQHLPAACSSGVEEITIPSAVELSASGVVLVGTAEGGIGSISFDMKTRELRLPVVTLDANSAALFGNLVAYEAASSCRNGPLCLARYTELMTGIIDTEEDARLLRERGVIISHLKSDAQVALLWNSMSTSLTLSKVPHLDRVIQHLNAYYNSCRRVRFRNFMDLHVFSSWQLLTFLAALLFFFLMTLQVFSSLFNTATNPTRTQTPNNN